MPLPSISSPWRRHVTMLGVAAAASLALACTGAPQSAGAQEGPSEPPRRMTVTGTGDAAAVPDTAMVNFGVMTEGKTARAALDANNTAMAEVLQSLKEAGLEDRDVQTSNFSIQPEYVRYPSGQTGPRRISGYRVSNQVTVIVRDLANLGAVLDRAVSDGANTFNGLSFTFSDMQPLQDEARVAAVKDARRKAELLTEAAGVRLGRVITLSENSGYRPPAPRMRAMAMEAAADVPIAAGESQVSVTVSITFEIE